MFLLQIRLETLFDISGLFNFTLETTGGRPMSLKWNKHERCHQKLKEKKQFGTWLTWLDFIRKKKGMI